MANAITPIDRDKDLQLAIDKELELDTSQLDYIMIC
jgi:hypothetical protein